MNKRAMVVLLALALLGGRWSHASPRADVVVAWNELAYEIAFAEDRFLTFKGQRALALMHLAMHDALNGIVPRYRAYAFQGKMPGADPVAAAARAAHDVLRGLYPDQAARLGAELNRWAHADDPRTLRGVEAGAQSARTILSLREDDGWSLEGTYAFASGPGAYQSTPDWNGFTLQPGFRLARPLVLQRPDQLRPPPPPPVDGAEAATALREVMAAGRKDRATRTPDQTAYAVWWMEFPEGSVNRLARSLVTGGALDLWDSARFFAALGASLYDTYVAVWDSKYEFGHWRPYTAIRADADPEWDSLLPAPPFPEYVSAHAAGCAASFTILERTFGGDVSFTMTTITAPPGMPSRSFTSFARAASECADSRIRLGWHFRYSTDRGLTLGRAAASLVDEQALRPVKEAK